MVYSHQYLIAITVISPIADPDQVPVDHLVSALLERTRDIILHDREAAFQIQDTAIISKKGS